MTKKEAFIKIIQTEIFDRTDIYAENFTSKEAAEALFTSGRSIAGSMRKLVNDGYVEKTGKDPVQYSLTEAGKNYQFDN